MVSVWFWDGLEVVGWFRDGLGGGWDAWGWFGADLGLVWGRFGRELDGETRVTIRAGLLSHWPGHGNLFPPPTTETWSSLEIIVFPSD